MVCQLSVSAIQSYMDSNRKMAENPLAEEIGKINAAASSGISALENEKNQLNIVVNCAIEVINGYIDECNHKISSIQFYLSEVPAERTVTRTVTTEVINEDGSKGTKTTEEKVSYHDPNHDALQAMLTQAKNCISALESYRGMCIKHLDDVRDIEIAIQNFRHEVDGAVTFGEKISESMGGHLKALGEQSKEAVKYLKGAKASCGPFPAITDDGGAIDLSGLGNYISNLKSRLEECSKGANKLVRIAEDLNSGWNDDVYSKFYNDTSSIRDNVISIMNELDYMNNALDTMYGRLYDYTQVTPFVKYESAYFGYSPVGLPWTGAATPISNTMKI